MAEYWYFKPEFEEKAKKFFDERPKPEMTLDFTIGVKDFVNAGKASSEIKLFLKRLGIDAKILRRVAIAAYEAEINETAHALGGRIYGHIYSEFVHVVFDDDGPGLPDIEQAMVPGWSTADSQVREMGFGAGLGLPNIKKNSDALHIESEKNSQTLLEFLVFY